VGKKNSHGEAYELYLNSKARDKISQIVDKYENGKKTPNNIASSLKLAISGGNSR
jgi:hypothetical protein